MAEYKGKLLKGLFTQAKRVILENGNTVESEMIKEKHYTFTRTIDSSTPTGFTTNNLHQIDASSDLAGKTVIGTSLYSDYSWAMGTANVQTGNLISATWAYVAVTSITVTFVITVYYKD